MKVIIAGSRDIIAPKHLVGEAVRRSGFKITTVISGAAKGIDLAGEAYAKHFKIPLEVFPADWNKHGKAAGPVRNTEMANVADALIAVWDGESKGTKNMINTAKSKGLQVFVLTVSLKNEFFNLEGEEDE